MHLQLPFNSSSHLFYLHDLRKSQNYMASCVDWGWGGIGFYTWCLLLSFSELEQNDTKESYVPGTAPPLDLIQLLLLGPKKQIHLTFV